jgi:hypothetical protein
MLKILFQHWQIYSCNTVLLNTHHLKNYAFLYYSIYLKICFSVLLKSCRDHRREWGDRIASIGEEQIAHRKAYLQVYWVIQKSIILQVMCVEQYSITRVYLSVLKQYLQHLNYYVLIFLSQFFIAFRVGKLDKLVKITAQFVLIHQLLQYTV